MKLILMILLTSMSFFANAQEVSVKINSEEPLIDESIQMIFTINGKVDEEPYISFNPGGAEILGKRSGGTSVSTTIINGRVSTVREMSIIYDIAFEKAGTKVIRDIKVDFGKGLIKELRNISLKVVSQRKTPPAIFVKAIPSKTEVYVGEGFDINYYLYTRVNTVAAEVEEFPKLNKFTKRFRMIRETVEAVKDNGVVYRRVLKYSARVFAEKTGSATIDPLRLRVQYMKGNSRFGGFGFGRSSIKSLRSRSIKIKVLPLPADNVPKSFTGLVGEHNFKFTLNRNRFLVNEAIELKLEVEGVGALEHYNAPKLFTHKDLEEFDTKSELVNVDLIKKKRVFDYTYLARAPLNIDSEEFEFSYFDPVTRGYITKRALLSGVKVGGKAISGASKEAKDMKKVIVEEKLTESKGHELVAPFFSLREIVLSKFNSSNLNLIISLLILVAFGSFLISSDSFRQKDKEAMRLARKMKKEGLSYSSLFQLLSKLGGSKEDDLVRRMKEAQISSKSIKYFSVLLEKSERANYKENKKVLAFKYESKYFSELIKAIEKSSYEDNKIS